MNVSRTGVQKATKIEKDGSEEIKKAVVDGSVTITDAAAIVDNPKPVQNEALKKVESGKAKTLKEAVKSKNGKPIYDDRKISDMIGKLVREIDERKNAIGKGKWHAEMIDAMEAVAVAWKRAQKERG